MTLAVDCANCGHHYEAEPQGSHRVLCGDSRRAEDIQKLAGGGRADAVLTDPPYGIDVNTDWSAVVANDRALLRGHAGKPHAKVIGDDEPFDPRPYVETFSSVKEQFWFGADYYRRLLSEDDRDGSWLVWDKRNEASDGAIGSNFELIWSKQRHKRTVLRFYWFGAFGMDTSHRLHPTQKPVGLLKEIISRWISDAGVVVDPFGGSGSTLIACEQTCRTAWVTEVDPGYIDVICARFQALTGLVPVLESTGEPHDFTPTP